MHCVADLTSDGLVDLVTFAPSIRLHGHEDWQVEAVYFFVPSNAALRANNQTRAASISSKKSTLYFLP